MDVYKLIYICVLTFKHFRARLVQRWGTTLESLGAYVATLVPYRICTVINRSISVSIPGLLFPVACKVYFLHSMIRQSVLIRSKRWDNRCCPSVQRYLTTFLQHHSDLCPFSIGNGSCSIWISTLMSMFLPSVVPLQISCILLDLMSSLFYDEGQTEHQH